MSTQYAVLDLDQTLILAGNSCFLPEIRNPNASQFLDLQESAVYRSHTIRLLHPTEIAMLLKFIVQEKIKLMVLTSGRWIQELFSLMVDQLELGEKTKEYCKKEVIFRSVDDDLTFYKRIYPEYNEEWLIPWLQDFPKAHRFYAYLFYQSLLEQGQKVTIDTMCRLASCSHNEKIREIVKGAIAYMNRENITATLLDDNVGHIKSFVCCNKLFRLRGILAPFPSSTPIHFQAMVQALKFQKGMMMFEKKEEEKSGLPCICFWKRRHSTTTQKNVKSQQRRKSCPSITGPYSRS